MGERQLLVADSPPAKPTGLRASTAQGSLDVSLDWNDVEGATTYKVRWRVAGPGNRLNDGLEAQSSNASIAHSNLDLEAGSGFPLGPFGLAGSSAINLAHDNAAWCLLCAGADMGRWRREEQMEPARDDARTQLEQHMVELPDTEEIALCSSQAIRRAAVAEEHGSGGQDRE